VISAAASGGIFSFRFAGSAIALLLPAVLIFIITCLLTGIPAAVVIWLSEQFRIRSVLFFSCAGGTIGALSQAVLFQSFSLPLAGIFILAGFLAGLEYWYVAERHAGREPG
jgi:hypothetical protein